MAYHLLARQTPYTKMQFVLEFQKLFTCNHIWLFVPVRTQINSTDIFFSLFFFPLKFYQKENISEMYVQCNLSPTDVWKLKYLLLNKKEHYYYAIITVFMGKAVNDKRGQRVAKYSLQAIPSLIVSPWLSSISIITGLLLLLIQWGWREPIHFLFFKTAHVLSNSMLYLLSNPSKTMVRKKLWKSSLFFSLL